MKEECKETRKVNVPLEMVPAGRRDTARSTSSWRPIFAAFMAGSLAIGGLLFAAGRMDVFGGDEPLAYNVSAQAPADSGIQTASFNGAGSGTLSSIVSQASPAVVKIETKTKASPNRSNPLSGSPFSRQRLDNGSSDASGQQYDSGALQPSGTGSGFLFESEGYILTNEHVIDGADEIDVYVQGYNEPFKAKLLGSSYDLDLAVIKIEGDKPFPALALGNSDASNVGDTVVAIGNPYEFDSTVTAGVLSAKERPIQIDDEQGTRYYKHLLQTDTAINPGNSGGPLLNVNGEVIGINTAVNADAQGIGFAIPSSTVSSVLDRLKHNESIPKEPLPYIGISALNITDDMLADLKLSSANGVLVADVQQQSPASAAGIRPYDVITAVDGADISSVQELTDKIEASPAGGEMTLTMSRNGQQQEVRVKIGDKNDLATTQK
ncbi:trypsin-like peptidase domain-containing protein [Paenibacillus thiaminolyticus]|uniref:PDZ domain-containing protein n=1 Tax=Paenibacillus thiaminolyticus TaxID=49283 RepID=A0AAP9DS58_PANTH|nr:trypsin-like peptidase domain-containing protein [Paenibacillus thiaminolyticus]MCY9535566.1 trypsin-like peptidase domain-containing protein [Paenibacillus thiaminolyticus]MCY9601661.1 trypsin-like peptidase domain-containing protein [Paenibacillus thiaminolyticus]MCY9610698.1 trypsin-like peptidase domain-containing protein [Paenibacillus thiaminolyticus]MCY9615889.1 trypsin-like peptidase domain-containing protein [Paenibacillus thiaminolyticus]MCY9622108.1 trypsin-like peptidase domain-